VRKYRVRPAGRGVHLLVLATVILLAVGMIGNRIARQAYPVYWI